MFNRLASSGSSICGRLVNWGEKISSIRRSVRFGDNGLATLLGDLRTSGSAGACGGFGGSVFVDNQRSTDTRSAGRSRQPQQRSHRLPDTLGPAKRGGGLTLRGVQTGIAGLDGEFRQKEESATQCPQLGMSWQESQE